MKWKFKRKAVNYIYISVFLFLTTLSQILFLPSNINANEKDINTSSFIRNFVKNEFLYKVEKKIESQKVDLNIKLLGLIPVKKMTVNVVPEIKLIPGGKPIGVKIQSDGLIVVGFSDIEVDEGYKQSPAAIGGVEIGDIILEAQDKKLENVYDMLDIVKSSNGKEIKIKLKRKENIKVIYLKPIKNKNNEYKIGLWIRDSTSGIGTLTYYDPKNNNFGALGHPINDVDTGILFPIRSGKIFDASIVGIEQGQRGRPGELKGIFLNDSAIGEIEKNTLCGIYGKLLKVYNNDIYKKPIPIAYQYEVKEGPAKILTTVDGTNVKEYDIVIEKVIQQTKPSSKSMIIRITDKELLKKAGGIVQGMSGSPIIQNGKIVGAVTHVFVNKPDMGYGIYIEWMLKQQGYDM
ncbi:SpoIVB peptidase. Serine peptidase. MEROPS family S55 [Caloramator fervidus]|uniref:SpoIVB peptidase. Serine peptidase. MEROPS family S55 n=1 Tax=Caloramator fervidus TaxID=29344 RepID=A0A1H5V862_9CLOT|nr:SpoIVB peptidase [Caloramator fervidus]SEF82637.1 SpoIVB peptidase. Serine peptidase. MEROPS family S55 [Caloramator fervidus]